MERICKFCSKPESKHFSMFQCCSGSGCPGFPSRGNTRNTFHFQPEEAKPVSEKVVNTTESRVLEAAQACPQARAALKTLFPEVFEDIAPLIIQARKDGPVTVLMDREDAELIAALGYCVGGPHLYTLAGGSPNDGALHLIVYKKAYPRGAEEMRDRLREISEPFRKALKVNY